MGLKEMFELSALLKMQLPVLSSFAIFRWLIGLAVVALGRRFPHTLAKARIGVAGFRRTLLVFGTALPSIALGHSLETARFPSSMEDLSYVCQDYSSYKVQGYLCATSLLCLATSNASIDLGLSLAALKGVADMSMFTLFLAPAVWIREYVGGGLFFTVVIISSLGYSTACYGDGSNPTNKIGGAVLAVCFSVLFLVTNAALVGLHYGYLTTRAVLRTLRRSVAKLFKLAMGREA